MLESDWHRNKILILKYQHLATLLKTTPAHTHRQGRKRQIGKTTNDNLHSNQMSFEELWQIFLEQMYVFQLMQKIQIPLVWSAHQQQTLLVWLEKKQKY